MHVNVVQHLLDLYKYAPVYVNDLAIRTADPWPFIMELQDLYKLEAQGN